MTDGPNSVTYAPGREDRHSRSERRSTALSMRVGIDATPLLGPLTGIGTYTSHLIAELAAADLQLVATAFTARGSGDLRSLVPPLVEVSGRRLPARALRAAWSRMDWPPVELASGRVDLFHGTNFVAPPTRRAASVVTVHDLAYLRYPEAVSAASLAYRELVPRALARGATVIAVSHAMAKEILEAYNLPPGRVHVTPLGIDEEWFSVSRDGERPSGIPRDYVLAVGTLEPRKNLTTLLDAYRMAIATDQELPPLVLVGGQGWGDRLDLGGLPDGLVVLTGHLPIAQLRRIVAGARLLAFPSTYEGFGLPPLEALACGVPVVAADLPVTRETLSDQAVFADPHSPEAFLDALFRGLDSPAGDSATRTERARRYTWQRCAAETLRVYRQTLG